MPLWHIYCPEGAYSAEDKQAFADRITDLYAQFELPRFYVSVVFEELPKDSLFVGGKPTNDFIRIWIDQIARRVPVADVPPGWSALAKRSLPSSRSGVSAGRSISTTVCCRSAQKG